MELVLFACFSLVTLGSAVMVVYHPHPVKSALFLIVTFFSMGGLYLLLNAEFIALMQILVYAGAVMVLFLFVIMLLNLKPRIGRREEFYNRLKIALPLAALMIGIILTVVFHPLAKLGEHGLQSEQWIISHGGNIKAVGEVLFRRYLLPFELTSVLLLIAVIGVVILGKKEIK